MNLRSLINLVHPLPEQPIDTTPLREAIIHQHCAYVDPGTRLAFRDWAASNGKGLTAQQYVELFDLFNSVADPSIPKEVILIALEVSHGPVQLEGILHILSAVRAQCPEWADLSESEWRKAFGEALGLLARGQFPHLTYIKKVTKTEYTGGSYDTLESSYEVLVTSAELQIQDQNFRQVIPEKPRGVIDRESSISIGGAQDVVLHSDQFSRIETFGNVLHALKRNWIWGENGMRGTGNLSRSAAKERLQYLHSNQAVLRKYASDTYGRPVLGLYATGRYLYQVQSWGMEIIALTQDDHSLITYSNRTEAAFIFPRWRVAGTFPVELSAIGLNGLCTSLSRDHDDRHGKFRLTALTLNAVAVPFSGIDVGASVNYTPQAALNYARYLRRFINRHGDPTPKLIADHIENRFQAAA